MNAARKKSATGEAGARSGMAWLAKFGLRGLAIVALLGGMVAGGFYLWRQFGAAAVSGPEYTLTVENIEITSPPAWIHADVRAEVFRDASWDSSRLSLLDPQLTVKIAQAFELHSWVAKVNRVSKHHPARVEVSLEYRRPVAMVEVVLAGQNGLLPVDLDGVLLPPNDFSPTQASQYPRISVGESIPAGPVGTPWGDTRVAGAAAIAATFTGKWNALSLYRIVASAPSNSGHRPVEATYHLQTRAGSTILWGHAPGHETRGEATASQKLARLTQYVADHGLLDAGPRIIEIDLRDAKGIATSPRTAGLDLDSPQSY